MRIGRLFPYLRRHRRAYLIGAVAIVVGDGLLLLAPWLLRQSIDALQADQIAAARQAALLMVLVTALGGFGKFVMRRWMIGASRVIEQEIRHDLTAKAFQLSPRNYDDYKVGDMMALATNDINAIRQMGLLPEGYVVNDYLTDTDAFFVKTDAPNGFKHFERLALSTQMEPDFDTGNMRYKARERYSFGFSDPRCVFGSPGAA